MTSTALRLPGCTKAVFQSPRSTSARRITFSVRAEKGLGEKIEEKTQVRIEARTAKLDTARTKSHLREIVELYIFMNHVLV